MYLYHKCISHMHVMNPVSFGPSLTSVSRAMLSRNRNPSDLRRGVYSDAARERSDSNGDTNDPLVSLSITF